MITPGFSPLRMPVPHRSALVCFFLLVLLVPDTRAVPGEDYGCTSSVLVPPQYRGSAFYDGRSDCKYGVNDDCPFALGNWSLVQSAILHYGIPYFSASSTNATFSTRGGAFSLFCLSSFERSGELMVFTIAPPTESEVRICGTLTLDYDGQRRSNGTAFFTLGVSAQGILPCGPADEYTSFPLAGFDIAAPPVAGCPARSAGVVPAAYVQPPVAVFPANALALSMPLRGSLVPSGYYATYLDATVQQVLCALSLTLVEHNAGDELTRWEMLFGDGALAQPVGCISFLRLGRSVAYAERFAGNSDMDVSCGGPAAVGGAGLCCWNWTFAFNGAADGSSIKALLNYFPPGWVPPGAAPSPSPPPPPPPLAPAQALSATTIVAAVAGALLGLAALAIARLITRHAALLRALEDAKCAQGDGDAGARDGLLTAGAQDSEGGGGGSGGESSVGEVELARAALSPRRGIQ